LSKQEFDIDISGEELPPGVEPGNLSGTDDPPEAPTPVGSSADELDASFDAALGGDDDFDVTVSGEPEPVPAPEPVSPESPGVRVPEPEKKPAPEKSVAKAAKSVPKAKKAAAKKPAKKSVAKATLAVPASEASAASTNNNNNNTSTKPGSGPAARLYAIFQKHQVEVNGQIMEGFVRVAFIDPDDPTGEPVETIKARNRDTALFKAGKLFGHGFEGTLVATPVSMWEEKPVRNQPREEFRVEVGT
jgi:outer membrane biosynthesis protein TonB